MGITDVAGVSQGSALQHLVTPRHQALGLRHNRAFNLGQACHPEGIVGGYLAGRVHVDVDFTTAVVLQRSVDMQAASGASTACEDPAVVV